MFAAENSKLQPCSPADDAGQFGENLCVEGTVGQKQGQLQYLNATSTGGRKQSLWCMWSDPHLFLLMVGITEHRLPLAASCSWCLWEKVELTELPGSLLIDEESVRVKGSGHCTILHVSYDQEADETPELVRGTTRTTLEI